MVTRKSVPGVSDVYCLRVIDESGEDYLYAKEQFVLVDLPEAARSQLLAAIAQSTHRGSPSSDFDLMGTTHVPKIAETTFHQF